MIFSQNYDKSDIEDLQSAIKTYKTTISQLKTQSISGFNQAYKERVRKKIESKQNSSVFYSFNLILPSTTTIYLNNFYEQIKKIAKVYEVNLSVIPTLFLPFPYGYLYTNSKGIAEFVENINLDYFFYETKTFFDKFESPAYIFKSKTHKLVIFENFEKTKEFITNNPSITGVVQQFIPPKTGKASVLKVL